MKIMGQTTVRAQKGTRFYTVCLIFVTQIPAGYISSTVLVAGNNVTDSMAQFGNFLRTFYKKDESYRKSDFTINYLGSASHMYTHTLYSRACVCNLHCIINPRRACAARVTVLGLCVCLSVSILALQATTQLMCDTNSCSATSARKIN